MYGLVNKAIEDFVCQNFGDDTWEAIKEKADVDVDVFISMDTYPDEITYRLVEAASHILDLPVPHVLETFGQYWVLYTAGEGYGELLNMAGDSMPAFLQNLDNLHARVGLAFPRLKPPMFRCTDIQADSLRLHYTSSRPGLAPMVIGLIKGLAQRFGEAITLMQIQSRDKGDPEDEFLIQFDAR